MTFNSSLQSNKHFKVKMDSFHTLIGQKCKASLPQQVIAVLWSSCCLPIISYCIWHRFAPKRMIHMQLFQTFRYHSSYSIDCSCCQLITVSCMNWVQFVECLENNSVLDVWALNNYAISYTEYLFQCLDSDRIFHIFSGRFGFYSIGSQQIGWSNSWNYTSQDEVERTE